MMRSALLLVGLLFFSCSSEDGTEDPIFCTEELRPGLEITVKEANTGSIITEGITVLADDGVTVDTLVNFNNAKTFVGAYEKTGSFVLIVEGERYLRFVSMDSIIVEKDACHVITEKREVILSPVR